MNQVNGDHPPAYQVFPDSLPEHFDLLKRDIAGRGVRVAIEITPESDIAASFPRTEGSLIGRDHAQDQANP